jgi:hypothetical protein
MQVQLSDLVFDTVMLFMGNGTLFTALDISNKVKETMPQARHKEVRDEVRALFTNVIEPAGWARSNIPVTLEDGTPQTAILYYPLSASWDLDNLYDAQKRAQTLAKVPQQNPLAVAPVSSSAVATSPANPLPVTITSATAQAATRDLWKQMFNSQPSLFPRK